MFLGLLSRLFRGSNDTLRLANMPSVESRSNHGLASGRRNHHKAILAMAHRRQAELFRLRLLAASRSLNDTISSNPRVRTLFKRWTRYVVVFSVLIFRFSRWYDERLSGSTLTLPTIPRWEPPRCPSTLHLQRPLDAALEGRR
jgi:hypothetical protein